MTLRRSHIAQHLAPSTFEETREATNAINENKTRVLVGQYPGRPPSYASGRVPIARAGMPTWARLTIDVDNKDVDNRRSTVVPPTVKPSYHRVRADELLSHQAVEWTDTASHPTVNVRTIDVRSHYNIKPSSCPLSAVGHQLSTMSYCWSHSSIKPSSRPLSAVGYQLSNLSTALFKLPRLRT